MKSLDIKKYKLPDSPGVYYFLGRKGKILYIGKATSLKDRVKSYLSKAVFDTRSPLIAKMITEANKITFMQTDSVLEALILEANLIKKHQPIYNSKEKDDKSYHYVIITKENFPRVLIVRGKAIQYGLPAEASAKAGPFPHSNELKEALKIVRKIFPYRDKCKLNQNRPCFNAQIGLCPGPCAGRISRKDYGKIIRHLKLFFEGQKGALLRVLVRNMKKFAKEQRFENAEKTKRQIFALKHIQDIALIKEASHAFPTSFETARSRRVEAYDIAHLSGVNVVGVMAVVENGELNKSQYRKFKIRFDGNNDIANLKEVLTRRFAHSEWRFPNLIVVDGGRGQINAAKEVLKKADLDIAVVSVVKDERHKAREILGPTKDLALEKSILLANGEAHRFAIKFHRQLRGKGFGI